MTAKDKGAFEFEFEPPAPPQQARPPRPPEPPKPPEPPNEDPQQPITLIAAAAVAVVVLVAGLWWLLGGGADDEAAPVAEVVAEPATPDPPAAPVELEEPAVIPEPVELPDLGDSDTFVRDLVDALLAHPNLAAWLVGENLIRQFVVVADNVANGRNPAQHMAVLRPQRRFRAAGDGEQMLIEHASYQRYDLIARVVGALDPRGAALLYGTIEPLLDEAHRELGYPDTPFRRTLGRAVGRLLAAPVVESPPVIVRRATLFLYADDRLEALTPAQKQFIGMGPDNVLVVQAQLRAIADEIGLILE